MRAEEDASEVQMKRVEDRAARLRAMRAELKVRTPAEVAKRQLEERHQAALAALNAVKGESAIAIQRTVRARAARMSVVALQRWWGAPT